MPGFAVGRRGKATQSLSSMLSIFRLCDNDDIDQEMPHSLIARATFMSWIIFDFPFLKIQTFESALQILSLMASWCWIRSLMEQ